LVSPVIWLPSLVWKVHCCEVGMRVPRLARP
jgi:hypothetical protein